MYRGRHDNTAGVAPEINSWSNAYPVAHITTGMGEIHMTSTTTADGFQCFRQGPMFPFQGPETLITPMPWIHVQYHQSRDRSGHDTQIGLRPTPEPAPNLLFICQSGLKRQPGYGGTLTSLTHGDDRLPETQILQCSQFGFFRYHEAALDSDQPTSL
jgi:hypothetical protein